MLIDKRDKKKRSQAQFFFQRSMCSVVVCKTKDCCGSLQTLEGWLWLWLRWVWNQWIQPLAKEYRLHSPQCWSNCTFWPVFCGFGSRSRLRNASGSLSGYDAQSDRKTTPLLNGTSALKLFCPNVNAPCFFSLPLNNFFLISTYPTIYHLYISPTSIPRKISKLF